MIKTLSKPGIKENFLNLLKGIYKTSTTNIILNGERLKAFSPRSGTRQRWPCSPLLFNIIWEILARELRQEKEITGIHIKKEK